MWDSESLSRPGGFELWSVWSQPPWGLGIHALPKGIQLYVITSSAIIPEQWLCHLDWGLTDSCPSPFRPVSAISTPHNCSLSPFGHLVFCSIFLHHLESLCFLFHPWGALPRGGHSCHFCNITALLAMVTPFSREVGRLSQIQLFKILAKCVLYGAFCASDLPDPFPSSFTLIWGKSVVTSNVNYLSESWEERLGRGPPNEILFKEIDYILLLWNHCWV